VMCRSGLFRPILGSSRRGWLVRVVCSLQLLLLIDRVRCLFRLHFFFGTAVSRIIRHSGKYGICEQRLWETNSRCTSDGLSRGCRWRGFLDSLLVWVSLVLA